VVVVTSREHTNMIRQDNGLSRCRPASSSALALIDRQISVAKIPFCSLHLEHSIIGSITPRGNKPRQGPNPASTPLAPF
jgi:hypothetical protein